MLNTSQDTVFAVKAPKGTTLEMPDPVEGTTLGGTRHYRCVMLGICSENKCPGACASSS